MQTLHTWLLRIFVIVAAVSVVRCWVLYARRLSQRDIFFAWFKKNYPEDVVKFPSRLKMISPFGYIVKFCQKDDPEYNDYVEQDKNLTKTIIHWMLITVICLGVPIIGMTCFGVDI